MWIPASTANTSIAINVKATKASVLQYPQEYTILRIFYMKITQIELSSRLLYLPIDLREKVLLWLTHKGLKPVSEITTNRRGNLLTLLRRGIKRKNDYDFNSPKSQRIKKWIQDAGMYFKPELEGNMSWHVGKDKNNVELSSEIIRKFDFENELKSGLLFGFPEESAKAYANNRVAKNNEQIPMIWPGNEHYFKGKYFAPYVLYNVTLEHAEKDSQTAKHWADTIRKDIPKLAEWFEKDEKRRRKKQESNTSKNI